MLIKKIFIIASVVSLFLIGISSGSAKGANSQPLVLTQGAYEFQYPVEQESPNYFFNNCGGNPGNPNCDSSTWVNNPTNCAWDSDDFIDVSGSGYISGSISGSLCVIADQYDNFSNDNHPVQVSVTSQSKNLTVTLSNDQGVFISATPLANGAGSWAYKICHIDETNGPYPVIANSNGGTGFSVNYTLAISSSKKVNGVFAVLQAGIRQFGIC
jgi:hypothetical protein